MRRVVRAQAASDWPMAAGAEPASSGVCPASRREESCPEVTDTASRIPGIAAFPDPPGFNTRRALSTRPVCTRRGDSQRERQRQAVCERECGHDLQDECEASTQQQQAEHEQDVIRADGDVVHARDDERAQHRPRASRTTRECARPDAPRRSASPTRDHRPAGRSAGARSPRVPGPRDPGIPAAKTTRASARPAPCPRPRRARSARSPLDR